ncbi:MAG TPA: hypothetical protein VK492_10085 [Chitinophagaceae bacterium]|nr:hypothetical protein [Chitinophagaceae bacterium]
MKKIILTTAFAFLLIFLSSCLTTLHPIFTEKNLAYDPKLIGVWNTENEGKKGKVTINNLATENSVELPGNISAIKQKGYFIIYQDENGKVSDQYIAFLARIGKHLYFDYFPADKKEDRKLDEFFGVHFVRMHTSYRVEILKDGSFELSQLDGSYVKSLIDEKKIRISHETDADDNTVITASTKELQQYLLKYGDEPSAYRSEKTTFKK